MGSYYALADGGKGIDRSCLLPLSGRAYLGRRKEGAGGAGGLADGQSAEGHGCSGKGG